MFEGMVIYAIMSLVVCLPSYLAGWLLLRLSGREVEPIVTWWSRTAGSRRGEAKRNVFLKYADSDREVFTAEYAFQVGCLFWLALFLVPPLLIWTLSLLL